MRCADATLDGVCEVYVGYVLYVHHPTHPMDTHHHVQIVYQLMCAQHILLLHCEQQRVRKMQGWRVVYVHAHASHQHHQQLLPNVVQCLYAGPVEVCSTVTEGIDGGTCSCMCMYVKDESEWGLGPYVYHIHAALWTCAHHTLQEHVHHALDL